jgi:probable DNA metabolism protein
VVSLSGHHMNVVVYDGSFAGMLSAIFDIYDYKMKEVTIVSSDAPQSSLFGELHTVQTNEAKANRVWSGLELWLSRIAINNIYIAFLSGIRGIENTLLQYIQYVFCSKKNIERDYSHPAVLAVTETVKKVRREKHRMEAFVRFQLTKDQLYYAVVQPDFNVLPLISHHFEKRYADQRWLIYDASRKYGIYYDLESVQEVNMHFDEGVQNGEYIASIHDEKEELYQTLWKQYFDSVNIKARKNTKLHIRHMPKRYWKYLPEKRPGMNS